MKNSTLKLWVVVAAAGVGSRFSAQIAKQYFKINDTYVIDYALSTLCQINNLCQIVVCIKQDDTLWQSSKFSSHQQITTAIGGKTRVNSVLNGLYKLIELGASDNDWAVVHDAARANVNLNDVNALINKVIALNCAGILAHPAYDSLKQVFVADDGNNYIKQNLERTNVWCAFTPQMARIGLLIDALKKYPTATDEAEALQNAGHKVCLVKSCKNNLKLTTSSDLAILKALLA